MSSATIASTEDTDSRLTFSAASRLRRKPVTTISGAAPSPSCCGAVTAAPSAACGVASVVVGTTAVWAGDGSVWVGVPGDAVAGICAACASAAPGIASARISAPAEIPRNCPARTVFRIATPFAILLSPAAKPH